MFYCCVVYRLFIGAQPYLPSDSPEFFLENAHITLTSLYHSLSFVFIRLLFLFIIITITTTILFIQILTNLRQLFAVDMFKYIFRYHK